MKRTWWQGARGAAAVACVTAACASAVAWGADPKPAAPADKPAAAKPAPRPAIKGKAQEVSDADVVTAMQKGIDYLLAMKKGDNWEVPGKKWPGNGETGGVTSVVLYALMHAGESLQDNPEYHAKLSYRGKELAPVVAWLSKNKPEDTYVAGLQSSALTLVPRRPDEKPDEGVRPSLEWCKWYLMEAMGGDGGYSYTSAPSPFPGAWETYMTEVAKGKRTSKEFTAAKTKLDQVAQGEYRGFGGPLLEMQKMAVDLQEKLKTAKSPAERAAIENEMRELDNYMHQMPQPVDLRKTIEGTKKKLEGDLSHNGDPKGLKRYDNATKKQVPMTKEDLVAEIEKLRKDLASQEDELKKQLAGTRFNPIGDLSNGQYGTLGAWALMEYGIEMPDQYWKVQDRFWRLMQDTDGGWPYNGAKPESSPTMSVAGIASLFIAQEYVDTELRLIPKPDKNLDRGLAWLSANFKPTANLYFMYGVERVGLSSGLKFFGTADWYKEGAATVVKAQAPDGSWSGGFYGSTDGGIGTAYGLLFLARGRNPVVFNKLQYNGPWDARPRDNAYITRWMSKRFEKPINWQIVNLQVSPEEWMDAPILMITGSRDPKFTKEDVEKLKAFVNAGGMIFSTADGGPGAGANFTNAIKKVATEVVDSKYEWRQLPKNHYLFSKEMGVDIPNPPQILGMSNGVREVWIHSPLDVGADWQMRKFSSKNFELGAALYFYASGMGSLRSKLQPLTIAAAGPAARSVEVARVDYSGNSDPEPGAWPRLAKLVRADANTDIKLSTVKIADLDPKKYPLAHMTGTARTVFNAGDVKTLQAYVNGGGLLFLDAAGGSQDFSISCQDLMKQMFPSDPSTPLAPDHPIFTGTMPDGAKIAEAEFRKYGNILLKRRVTKPMMEEIVTGGRTRVLFSQWDICSGFLGTNTWGIVGYAPSTAEALGRNIVLYALNPVEQVGAAATN